MIKKEHQKFFRFFSTVPVILSVFLIALTVFVVVGTVNKIKEGKYIGQNIVAAKTISVSGKGEVFAKPDLAIIDFSVISQAKTVEAVLTDNAEKMNKIIASLKEQGIEDEDLKTTYFYLSPCYEYQKEDTEIYPYPPGKRVLVGYETSQTLEVKIRDLEKIGAIIEKAAENGANQLGDLQLTIEKQDELKEEARAQAIETAKAKAEKLASQLGVKLVNLVNFYESGETPYYYEYEATKGLGGGELPSAAPDIETGQNKIIVNVTLIYEIK